MNFVLRGRHEERHTGNVRPGSARIERPVTGGAHANDASGVLRNLAGDRLATDTFDLPSTSSSTVYEDADVVIGNVSDARHESTNVAVVIGTRPEAIKLAPVCRLLHERGASISVVLTGQHRELVDELLGPLDITKFVHADLEVMKPRQDLSALASCLFDRLGSYLAKTQPDALVVQGDTTSALCGAIAAFHEKVPVAHVEAGLRSGNLGDPFPEELNRQMISRAAHWQFAPTETAAENLRDEGIDPGRIHIVGNTVVDSLEWVLCKGIGTSAFATNGMAARKPKALRVLVTLHRRETRGVALRALAEAIARMATAHGVEIVFPVHPSPDVRDEVMPALGTASGVHLREPLGYFDFLATLAEADLAISDSGGVQEEAPTFGTPVLVVRETTERPEAIAAGCALLAGTDPIRLESLVAELVAHPERRARMSGGVNPFGDGHAAERIADVMLDDVCSTAVVS